jgi:hypothetical protein
VAPLRILLLAAAIAALSWFQFVNLASASDLSRDAADLLDPRSPRDILFVGNSRMFTNDLPSMVRAVADSADAPVKYRVRMRALPGVTFVYHANSETLRALLAQRWDRVVLQSESAAQMDEDSRANFHAYGGQLVALARKGGSPSSLVVNWVYGEDLFRHIYGEETFRDYPDWTRAAFHSLIQKEHRALARESGAGLINVGAMFRRVEAARPDLALTPDGNHPSPHGTYVYALMVYADLSGADVRRVRYVPAGVTEQDALDLRVLVGDYLSSHPARPGA